MNKIALRQIKLDIHKIINMNMSKKDWGKIYTIFTHQSVTVTLQMTSFNFLKDKATFLFNINSIKNEDEFSCEDVIEYERKHMTLNFFKNYINRKLITIINYHIERKLRGEASIKYSDLYHMYGTITDEEIIDCDFEEELEQANNLPQSIKEDTLDLIRNKVRDSLNEKYNHLVDEYEENNKIDNEDIYSFLDSIKIKEDDKE